jgi:hypothetical protein
MSKILNEFQHDDLRVLDRLVDGELSESDRRELLAALDDEPGAWRRCALTFLEAQTWRGDLEAYRSPHVAREEIIARSVMSTVTRRVGWFLAMAASVVVAFGLGLKLRDLHLLGGPHGDNGNIARDEDRAPEVNRPQVQVAADHSSKSPSRWQTFKLGVGGEEAIEVPALEAARFDQDWLENQASAIPPDLVRLLERSGHEIRRERELWPINLQDGRRLIVPVEQYELQYVGGSKFQ